MPGSSKLRSSLQSVVVVVASRWCMHTHTDTDKYNYQEKRVLGVLQHGRLDTRRKRDTRRTEIWKFMRERSDFTDHYEMQRRRDCETVQRYSASACRELCYLFDD